MALRHNSKVADNEPEWGDWIKKNRSKLPYNAFAEGEEDKKSTWAFPHHWVENGEDTDGDGIWDKGDMYLHKGGLNAAWAAARGARSGKKASSEVIAHLRAHRRALGLEKGEKQSLSVPKDALRLGETLSCSFALSEKSEDDDTPGVPFEMTVYSGEIIPNHWWWGNLAIDLDGIQIYKQELPVLRDHEPDRIVGYTKRIKVENGRVKVKGYILEDTEDGQEVVKLSKKGFPWQASMYIPPLSIERVEPGGSADVNGKILRGPGTIFRQSVLRECSFCVLGADKHTKARALADSDKQSLEIEVFNSNHEEKEGEKVSIESIEQLKEQYPELCNKLAQEAIAQERQRIMDIQSAAFEGQEDLVKKLVEEGTSVEEAVKQLNQDFKEKIAQKKEDVLNNFKESDPPTVGFGKGKDETNDSNKNPEDELEEAVDNWLNEGKDNKQE